MSKIIDYSILTNKLEELIINTSTSLPKDILSELEKHKSNSLINIILENNTIANKKTLPLCQDTGISTFFIEYGNVTISSNKTIYEAINNAVKNAYSINLLRPSIVDDPLTGRNTNNNTPAFIHIDLVNNNDLIIHYLAKGGGSENLSALFMCSPTDSDKIIKSKIIKHIKENIINACPPVIVGIGIGGTADWALKNSKKVLLNKINTRNLDPYYSKLETDLKKEINNLNIGPFGFGSGPTALDVFIKKEARHIATMPIAISIFCHSARRGTLVL